MIVLGIDPGTTRIGVGIIQKQGQKFHPLHYGLLVPEKQLVSLPLEEKLCLIYEAMVHLILSYKPQVMGIETLIFAKNVSTAFPVAHSRGVILLAGAQQKIPLLELSPTQVKRGITTQGNADKTQVAFMAKTILSLPKDKKIVDDSTDALAIAITAANHWHSGALLRSALVAKPIH